MRKIIKFIPNIITASRIVMTFFFVTGIYGQFIYDKDNLSFLTVLFLAICLSDLSDGRIARKTGYTSTSGAKLDVFADLFFITLSNMALISVKVLPLWFLGFIFVKFIEFVLTSNFIIKHNSSPKETFIFDRLGRIASAMFFIIPGIACILQGIFPSYAEYLIGSLLYMIFAAGIYSSYLRVKSCFGLASVSRVYKRQNYYNTNKKAS